MPVEPVDVELLTNNRRLDCFAAALERGLPHERTFFVLPSRNVKSSPLPELLGLEEGLHTRRLHPDIGVGAGDRARLGRETV